MRISIVGILVAVSSMSLAQTVREEARSKAGESTVVAVGECTRAEKRVSQNNNIVIESKFAYATCNETINYRVVITESGKKMDFWPDVKDVPGSHQSVYALDSKDKVYNALLKTQENQVATDSTGRPLPPHLQPSVESEASQLAKIRGLCEQNRDLYLAQVKSVAYPACAASQLK